MRQLLIFGTLFLVGLLALASPVQAGEWVEGDGFAFRLPDGYSRLSGSLADDVTSLNMSMGGGLLGGPDIEMEMQAFARDYGTTEQGVLAVVRMTLGGDLGEKLKGQFDPQTMVRQMQQGMERGSQQLGAHGAEVIEVKTITLGASHEAALMAFRAEDPKLGDQVIRMAFSNYESSIYIFMLQGPPSREAADESLWRAFTSTVRLQSVGGIGRMLARYWPYLVGAVVLLLIVVFARSRSTPARRRVAFESGSPAAEMNADGASFSRAMDGLPMYGEPGGSPGAGPGLSEPSLPRSPEAAPRPTPRTVPTSAPAELPGLKRPGAPSAGPLSEPDLARPPVSAGPPSAPAGGRGVSPLVSSEAPRPTNVADRARSEPSDEAPPDLPGNRFQRNQDFLG